MTTTRLRGALLLAAVCGTVAVGCGSSSSGPAKDPNATATQASVDTFCQTADTLVATIKTTAAAGGPIDAINAQIKNLNDAAKALTSANSFATAGVNECLTKALTALQTAGLAPKGSSTGSTTKPTTKPGTPDTSGGSTGNAEVDKFCADIKDLVQKAKDTGGDATKAAEVAKEAEALSTKIPALIAANPAAADAIRKCATDIASALGGGIPTPTLNLPTTVAPATTATNGADTTAAPQSGDTAAFCKEVDDLVAKIKPALTDPSKAADLATLMQQLQDLVKKGTDIAASNPSEAGAVSDCLQKLSALGG